MLTDERSDPFPSVLNLGIILREGHPCYLSGQVIRPRYNHCRSVRAAFLYRSCIRSRIYSLFGTD